jgi:hypothetical protein
MPERGGDIFSTRTFSIHHSTYPKQKELNHSRKTARKEGGRRFSQNATLPRVDLIDKQTIYRGTAKKKLRPGNDLVERGGDVFPRKTTLTSVALNDNNLPPEGL